MEIGNLHLHVQKGYLSDIPLDEHNKRLDHLLNRSWISGATLILVELAIYQRIPYLLHTPSNKIKSSACNLWRFQTTWNKGSNFQRLPWHIYWFISLYMYWQKPLIFLGLVSLQILTPNPPSHKITQLLTTAPICIHSSTLADMLIYLLINLLQRLLYLYPPEL